MVRRAVHLQDTAVEAQVSREGERAEPAGDVVEGGSVHCGCGGEVDGVEAEELGEDVDVGCGGGRGRAARGREVEGVDVGLKEGDCVREPGMGWGGGGIIARGLAVVELIDLSPVVLVRNCLCLDAEGCADHVSSS